MRLVQFTIPGLEGQNIGILNNDQIINLNTADPELPRTILEVLRKGLLKNCQEAGAKSTVSLPRSGVKLLAPVTGGDKVIGVGLNYSGHCKEQNLPIPTEPIFFSKFPSCIIGPTDTIQLRENITQSVDWEVELAVVIGKEARDVPRDKALQYVAGYCVAQDISARDWQKQRNGGQFLIGKSMDCFLPLGPALVTADEVPDPHSLAVQCSVNGELKQSGSTSELICRIDDVINKLSSYFTLLPGDLILTGTPSGVGMHRKPPQFLRPGNQVHSLIEGIGELNNPVAAYKPLSI